MKLSTTFTKLLAIFIIAWLSAANEEAQDDAALREALNVSVARVHNVSKLRKLTTIGAIEEIAHEDDDEISKLLLISEAEEFNNGFDEEPLDNQKAATAGEEVVADKVVMRSSVRAWLKSNRDRILNVLLVVIGFSLFALITYKYYTINLSIKEQREQIQNYANQLESIIEGSDKLVFATWKDQRENIHFVDNPAYKKKIEGELTKAQQIEAEIANVQEDIGKKLRDVDNLREKATYYDNEIATLEAELSEAKTRVLDEGAALGFADAVLREFR